MKGTAILKKRPDDRGHARGAQVMRRQHALYYKEVGGPIAEADDKA